MKSYWGKMTQVVSKDDDTDVTQNEVAVYKTDSIKEPFVLELEEKTGCSKTLILDTVLNLRRSETILSEPNIFSILL